VWRSKYPRPPRWGGGSFVGAGGGGGGGGGGGEGSLVRPTQFLLVLGRS